jgi:hypothetical protein
LANCFHRQSDSNPSHIIDDLYAISSFTLRPGVQELSPCYATVKIISSDVLAAASDDDGDDVMVLKVDAPVVEDPSKVVEVCVMENSSVLLLLPDPPPESSVDVLELGGVGVTGDSVDRLGEDEIVVGRSVSVSVATGVSEVLLATDVESSVGVGGGMLLSELGYDGVKIGTLSVVIPASEEADVV